MWAVYITAIGWSLVAAPALAADRPPGDPPREAAGARRDRRDAAHDGKDARHPRDRLPDDLVDIRADRRAMGRAGLRDERDERADRRDLRADVREARRDREELRADGGRDGRAEARRDQERRDRRDRERHGRMR